MSLNKFQFIGNLTRDADFRHSDNGGWAVLILAVDDPLGNKQGKTPPDYFRIKAFKRLAETAGQYLGKGSKIYIEGRIKTTRDRREDGSIDYGYDYIAEYIQYLDTKAPGARESKGLQHDG